MQNLKNGTLIYFFKHSLVTVCAEILSIIFPSVYVQILHVAYNTTNKFLLALQFWSFFITCYIWRFFKDN